MRRSPLFILILLLSCLISACTGDNPNNEPPPPWKVKQIKLVNDYFERYTKKGKLEELFCEYTPVTDLGEVKAWQIVDDREVSQQLGKFVVKLSKTGNLNPVPNPKNPNQDTFLVEVTVFRVTEFEEEFCVHKVVDKEPEVEEEATEQ